MFTMIFKTDNDAFHDSEHYDRGDQNGLHINGEEIARILRRAADQVQDGVCSAPVKDINGNTVGSFELRQRDADVAVAS